MPWTKPLGTSTAKAGAHDVSCHMRWDEPSQDWLVVFTLDTDDGLPPKSSAHLLEAAVARGLITDDQRTRLLNIVRALRDGALTDLGYT